MKTFGVIVALISMFIGLWTAALPNVSQKLPGYLLVGYGVVVLILALIGRDTLLKILLAGTAILVLVAYALPMSFWERAGLVERPGKE